jgi:hypothetical protein
MKYLIAFIIVFSVSAAHAATFDNVKDASGMLWIYQFQVKDKASKNSTPVTIYEKNWRYYQTSNPNLQAKMFIQMTDCFKTEDEARVDAQKKADKYEVDFIANGMSSDHVEQVRKNAQPH